MKLLQIFPIYENFEHVIITVAEDEASPILMSQETTKSTLKFKFQIKQLNVGIISSILSQFYPISVPIQRTRLRSETKFNTNEQM